MSQKYEYAYMTMNKIVEKSGNQHENIILQLQNGQFQKPQNYWLKIIWLQWMH